MPHYEQELGTLPGFTLGFIWVIVAHPNTKVDM